MTVAEQLAVLSGPDNILIVRDAETETEQKTVYMGYLGMMPTAILPESVLDAEVKRFRVCQDIKHKQWRERGLLPPLEPEQTPDYSFSDLQMTLYYKIII